MPGCQEGDWSSWQAASAEEQSRGIRYGGRVIEVRQPTPADLEALADILSAAELGCGPVGAHVIDPGSAHVIEPVLGGPG